MSKVTKLPKSENIRNIQSSKHGNLYQFNVINRFPVFPVLSYLAHVSQRVYAAEEDALYELFSLLGG